MALGWKTKYSYLEDAGWESPPSVTSVVLKVLKNTFFFFIKQDEIHNLFIIVKVKQSSSRCVSSIL